LNFDVSHFKRGYRLFDFRNRRFRGYLEAMQLASHRTTGRSTLMQPQSICQF
jgi:hypothetical protein